MKFENIKTAVRDFIKYHQIRTALIAVITIVGIGTFDFDMPWFFRCLCTGGYVFALALAIYADE